MLLPVVPDILSKQNSSGLWKKKDSERISHDILRALKHTDILNDLIACNRFKYDPQRKLANKFDIYSLITKRHVFNSTDIKDIDKINELIKHIKESQQKNGSWNNTIVGTTYNLRKLLDLGKDATDSSVKKGVEFLFSVFNEQINAFHIASPYGLKAKCFFSTEDRNKEFEDAVSLRPEWIPRSVCFRHLSIQQHSECLNLLITLGFENDPRVESALDNIYEILEKYNGLCDSDIKKTYLGISE